MLDSTVAGGFRTGEDPFETGIHQVGEEASLRTDLLRSTPEPCEPLTSNTCPRGMSKAKGIFSNRKWTMCANGSPDWGEVTALK